MIVLVNHVLVPKGMIGIALWPFLVIQDASLKVDAVFMNHERIHLRQQQELLIVFFYVWYGIEFTIRLIHYKNRHDAYRNISFEQEAYANEEAILYLRKRRFWSFLRYL